MKVGITDGTGRLGKILAEYYPVINGIDDVNDFDVIIHNGAYTDVDNAELEIGKVVHENIYLTNILRFRTNAKIIYISTDFIFDGESGPYLEHAQPCPINVYGWTKWMGERLLHPSDIVVRTTVLYGGHKSDFVTWTLDKLDKNEEFVVKSFMWTTPTNVYHLVEALQYIIEHNIDIPIINIACHEYMSRMEFAVRIAEIFEFSSEKILSTAQHYGRANRPHLAGLRTDLATEVGIPIYSVMDGLNLMKKMMYGQII